MDKATLQCEPLGVIIQIIQLKKTKKFRKSIKQIDFQNQTNKKYIHIITPNGPFYNFNVSTMRHFALTILILRNVYVYILKTTKTHLFYLTHISTETDNVIAYELT